LRLQKYKTQVFQWPPWTEELSLEKETIYLLKRLLSIKEPYSNTSEISTDLHAALEEKEKVH
jgi:serine/threonine-protein kinase